VSKAEMKSKKKRSKKGAPATPMKKPNYLAQMMGQKRMM
jgi:hypothetical protein